MACPLARLGQGRWPASNARTEVAIDAREQVERALTPTDGRRVSPLGYSIAGLIIPDDPNMTLRVTGLVLGLCTLIVGHLTALERSGSASQDG